MVSSKKSNTIAALGTVIFMLLVFLLLWFICINRMQEPEDEGIEVAFGVTEEGGGYQPEQTTGGLEEAVAPPPAPQEPSNNDLIAQEDEESIEVQRQREEAEKARQKAEQERQERERALAEQRAKEQAAIAKANQLGSLFGNTGGTGSGDTQGDSQRGNSEVGKGSSGGTSWSLAGRKCKALPKPSNDFKQEGKVVVAIIVDGSGKVVSAKATEGTTISNDATIQLALKAAYKAEFSFTDRPDKQFGTITYIFKFN